MPPIRRRPNESYKDFVARRQKAKDIDQYARDKYGHDQVLALLRQDRKERRAERNMERENAEYLRQQQAQARQEAREQRHRDLQEQRYLRDSNRELTLSGRMFYATRKRKREQNLSRKDKYSKYRGFEVPVLGDEGDPLYRLRFRVFGAPEKRTEQYWQDVYGAGPGESPGNGHYPYPISEFDFFQRFIDFMYEERGCGTYRSNNVYNYSWVCDYANSSLDVKLYNVPNYAWNGVTVTPGYSIMPSIFSIPLKILDGTPAERYSLSEARDLRLAMYTQMNYWLKNSYEFKGFGSFDDFADQGWETMRPSLDGKFSLLNFLFELKDFKSLLRLSPSPKKFFSIFKRSTLTLSGGLQLLSELHLTWCFAIAPLMSDLQKLFDRLLNHTKIIRDFVAAGRGDNGKPIHRRYIKRYHVTDMFPAKVPVNYSNGLVGYCTFDAIPGEKTEIYQACHCGFTYSSTPLDNQLKWMQAKLDVFGVNLNAAHAWNALPFTFVVDWFVDVSQFLHARRIEAFKALNVRLHYFAVTRKVSVRVSYWVTGADGANTLLQRVSYRSFERQNTVPKNLQSLRFGEFTEGKISLGLSLSKALTAKRRLID